VIWPGKEQEYFCKWGWTGKSADGGGDNKSRRLWTHISLQVNDADS
jgi:hypothetical protein